MLKRVLAEIYRRDRVLALTGWLHVALFAAMLAAAATDPRQLLGHEVWIKPIKFAISITIYVWTIAWFLDYLTGPPWALRLISRGTATAMIVEIVCIAGQAARGTRSHFNDAKLFDGAVFTVMGLMITFNLLLAGLMLGLFFNRHRPLAWPYLWGIRLGLALSIASGCIGFVMVHNHAHAVGVADGGEGLPMAGWSTRGGDLRVAHALGLHALQVLPLVGFWISRGWVGTRPGWAGLLLGLTTLLYAGAMGWVFWQALSGRPLVTMHEPAVSMRSCAPGLLPDPAESFKLSDRRRL